MEKIWLRLGGFITADNKTIEDILAGDEEALVKAIKMHGFEVNGNGYIPETGTEFELNPVVLTFFRDGEI